jgi:hypothetical protein
VAWPSRQEIDNALRFAPRTARGSNSTALRSGATARASGRSIAPSPLVANQAARSNTRRESGACCPLVRMVRRIRDLPPDVRWRHHRRAARYSRRRGRSMSQSPMEKRQKAEPRSRLHRLHDRLVTMCVVETTAARQSGMRSWKTEPCRVLLRILTKPAQSE